VTRTTVREVIPDALVGQRLDRVVSFATGLPRSEVAQLVASGAVSVGGRAVTRPGRRMAAGEILELEVPEREGSLPAPDATVPVAVVHEDPWLVVVDKPAGLIVHPGAGNPTRTLVNGLLARFPEMAGVGDPTRPGIVHRLDKGTSGLLIVARTQPAYAALVRSLAQRQVRRSYLALVAGHPEAERGVIDAPIGRSARQPTRMAVAVAGREARTGYLVVERFELPERAALLDCSLETGRTHQIRVHLAAIGHPVVGDHRYGRARSLVPSPGRPFLHAYRVAFEHPDGSGPVEYDSPLPGDLEEVLRSLRGAGDTESGGGLSGGG
jgi:23S rRNA pseudouridine1911/1915/1917 synthase